MKKILVLEDEASIRSFIVINLLFTIKIPYNYIIIGNLSQEIFTLGTGQKDKLFYKK